MHRVIKKFVFATLVALTIQPVPIQASHLNEDALRINEITQYDTVETLTECAPEQKEVVIVNRDDNHEYAYNWFRSGDRLTDNQSAGLVGNLIAESDVEPRRKQGAGYLLINDFSEVTSGTGYGIAQWTYSGRQDAWKAYADELQLDPLLLEMQVQFVWKELSEDPSYGLEHLLNAQTVEEAAWIILSRFERPAKVIDDPQFGGRNNYRPTVEPPTSGPAFDVLTERTQYGDGIIAQYGGGEANPAGQATCTNISDPGAGNVDFSAQSDIQIDGSPPGAHNPDNCTGGFTVGAEALRQYVLGQWSPPVTSVGGYSCRPISHNASNPTSVHGLGRAIDIMVDGTTPEGRQTGDEIRNFLIENARTLGIQRIIWYEYTWVADRDGWNAYTGAFDHKDHLHVEINIEAGNNANLI